MASTNIARLGVVLGLDTAEFTASIDKAITENRKLGMQIKKDSEAAAGEIIRLKFATEDYGKALTQVDLVQREISSGRFANANASIKEQLLQQAKALDVVRTSTKGAAHEMNAFQKQSLMYQTTDFFTQIGSGQSPMIALLQQGGQLKDTMGGFGPMLEKLAPLFTATRLAMATVGTAAIAVAYAMYQGHAEYARLRDDLILTNNFAGTTQYNIRALSLTLSNDLNVSVGKANEVLHLLAASGQYTEKTFDSVAGVILTFSKLSGMNAADSAKKLMSSLDGTASSSKRLNDEYNFLTLAQYKQIEALEKSGKKQEAIILQSDLLKTSWASQKRDIGILQEGWEGLLRVISATWSVMENWGKPEAPMAGLARLGNQISLVTAEIARLETEKFGGLGKGRLDALKETLAQHVIDVKILSEKAQKEAEDIKNKKGEKNTIDPYAAAGGEAKVKADQAALSKLQSDVAYAARINFASELQKIDMDAEKETAAAKNEFALLQYQQQGSMTLLNTQKLAEQTALIELNRLNKVFAYKKTIMLKEFDEEEQIQKEKNEADAAKFKLDSERRIAAGLQFKMQIDSLQYDKDKLAVQQKMLGSTDRELKQELLLLDVAKEIKAINESTIPDEDKTTEIGRIRTRERLQSLQIDAQDRFSKVKEMTDSIFSNMGSAIDNFVKTGKLGFKDFARSVIQDLIAIQLKAQATSLLGMAMKSIPGFGYTAGGSFASNLPDNIDIGGGWSPRASGGPVSSDSLYMVGEQGPEMFVPSSAGTIIPNGALSGMGGGGQTINYNGPFIQSMSAIDTQSGLQFLAKNKQSVWSAYQSANRGIPMSR